MKTKVVAFRVTQEEHDALLVCAMAHEVKLNHLLTALVKPAIDEGLSAIDRQRKKEAAKARREAKKAAANGAQ